MHNSTQLSQSASFASTNDSLHPARIGSSHGMIRGGRVVQTSSTQGHGVGRLGPVDDASPSSRPGSQTGSSRNYFNNVTGAKGVVNHSIPNPPSQLSGVMVSESVGEAGEGLAGTPSWSSDSYKSRITLTSRGGTRRASAADAQTLTPAPAVPAVKRHASISIAQERSQALTKKLDQLRTSGGQDGVLSRSSSVVVVGDVPPLGHSGFESRSTAAGTAPTNPLARRASQVNPQAPGRASVSKGCNALDDSSELAKREPVTSSGCCC